MSFELTTAQQQILDEMSILVVDDIQDNLDLVEVLLIDAGHENVICVGSGFEALEVLAGDEEIGLVLLDIMMPEMDGYEVLDRIISNPEWRHIPVMMVTGGALRQNEALEKSFRLGAIDYISKPVNEVELAWRVHSSLLLYCERITIKRQTTQILASEEKFRALFENTMDECSLIDPESLRVIDVNQSLKNNTGFIQLPSEFSGLYPHGQRSVELQALGQLGQNGFVRYESVRNRLDHENYPVDVQITSVNYGDNNVYFMVQRDISERKRHEEGLRKVTEQLNYLAAHDPLTGLPNRREFEYLLKRAITIARTEDQAHCLCYIDLDQFKIINDTHGHGCGDMVLQQVADLMRENIRKTDLLARLGGDEFGLILQGCDPPNALRIIGQIRNALTHHRFPVGEREFRVRASFGLVSINENAGSFSELLAAADSACYASKELGRDRIHVYTEDDSVLNERRQAMQWVNGINKALQENRFSLYCQPIISLREGKHSAPHHWEILLRDIDEKGDLITPDAFIMAAERYHVMPAIDQWVLPEALNMVESFFQQKADDGVDYMFSINLSAAAVGDDWTLRLITNELNKREIPNGSVCFEITETAIIQNISAAINFIGELRRLGCKFSMDDFGRGSSNFVYLRELPLDFVKIDGSFVRNVVDDELSRSIINSIQDASRILGIETVAEFVEDEKILDLIAEIGIDYAQGFQISRPLPMSELLNAN